MTRRPYYLPWSAPKIPFRDASHMSVPRTAGRDIRVVPAALREEIGRALADVQDRVAAAAVKECRDVPVAPLEAADQTRVALMLVQALAAAVRGGGVDADDPDDLTSELVGIALDRSIPTRELFNLATTLLDKVNDALTTDAVRHEPSSVREVIRRAFVQVLAAYTDGLVADSTEGRITDRLTTLYTRPIFDAVLVKELERSRRFGQNLSVILFDVDHLAAINASYGYRVGDRVLERLGVLMRQYFRQHDWAALHAEDSIVVLLPRTAAEEAGVLADRVRATVEHRLGFTHRSNEIVPVTISAAVVHVGVGSATTEVSPHALLAAAEATLARAKRNGRNRVEQITYSATAIG